MDSRFRHTEIQSYRACGNCYCPSCICIDEYTGNVVTAASDAKRANARNAKTRASTKFVKRPRSRSWPVGDLTLSQLDQAPSSAPSASLRLQQARTIAELLAIIGLPAGVLSAFGEVLASNKPLAALVPGTLRELHGRLHLTDANADRLVKNAIARLRASAGAPFCIPVRSGTGEPPAVVSLIPLSGFAEDALLGPVAVLVIDLVQPGPTPNAKILQDLFDLSPAEARVAQRIAGRETIDAIARRSGVSRETVRCQLKAVLAKTGTKRQLDLAVLLAGLWLHHYA